MARRGAAARARVAPPESGARAPRGVDAIVQAPAGRAPRVGVACGPHAAAAGGGLSRARRPPDQDAPVKVSIVVPTWNGEHFLGPCLEAVGAQSYHEIEVIVVDNGSTDASRALLASRFPSARVVTFAENRGFSVAVNAGIQASAGDVVALLNNDARPEP